MKNHPQSSSKRHRGVIMIMMIIALPAMLTVAGLALDSGRVYGVRAKLFAAVDAASLAAAKAIANGEVAATAAAEKYFAANFPAGYFGATPVLSSVTYSYSADGDVTINANATADLPMSLLQMTGWDTMDVDVNAQTIRRPVDLAFVVDNTTSLRLGSIGDVTQDVVDRSKDFVDNFHESFDRIALIKYAYGAETPVPFGIDRGFNKSSVKSEIDDFEFGSTFNPQYTNSSEGFWNALNQLRTINDPASLKVIVFFNDGAPNTFASRFSFDDGTVSSGSIRSSDGSSGTPYGLWDYDAVADRAGTYYGSNINNELSGLPDYYMPHDSSENEFKVLNPSHSRRPVTDFTSGDRNDLYRKVNRVSRNLVEDMAEAARQEGILVFTLGLGSRLTEPTGPDNERGEDLLLRMANDPTMLNNSDLADDFRPDQSQGLYCFARDEAALGPCFEKMLEVIIRLTI